MKRLIAVALITVLVVAYVTDIGILVWQGQVENRGEGGPSLDCVYLGAMGPVQIGFFVGDTPGQEKAHPASRSVCPWYCVLKKDSFRLGVRNITAWQCASL